VLKYDDDDDDESPSGHTNSSFSFQLKVLNILHPQPEINLPIALFKLATVLVTDGVSKYFWHGETAISAFRNKPHRMLKSLFYKYCSCHIQGRCLWG
jgi:hypothetical protein